MYSSGSDVMYVILWFSAPREEYPTVGCWVSSSAAATAALAEENILRNSFGHCALGVVEGEQYSVLQQAVNQGKLSWPLPLSSI